MVTSNEIRRLFLEYFQQHGHQIVPGGSLVPANDPTLLFTNSGMVQFKEVFLGIDKQPYQRAVTSQRCVRAGGKHNDLENVGYTARHHTFFEMLGNFSFGDYFKKEAIRHSWTLLTEGYGLAKDRLWITVFEDDDEAAEIWASDIGVARERIIRCGEKDNFWSMGDTGPCGPCSEIFYDHGPGVAGGPPGSPDEGGDRYIEIWNLVFMQFNRSADGSLEPLPKPSVDTGMGLERLAAVLQGVHSNYEIDLFKNLIKGVAEITKTPDLQDQSLYVIADHIRSCAFLVVDGVVPSNEGRGYVLRRIMRRALRHGHQLGMRKPFFHLLIQSLDQEMGDAYPELHQRRERVEQVLLQEEERFAETLDNGMRLFEQAISTLTGSVISGEIVFRLYDTYGFPLDLTADLARERSLTIDESGFAEAMEAQRARAREASAFGTQRTADFHPQLTSEFTGYQTLEDKVMIEAIFVDGKEVQSLSVEETGLVITDRSPFYPESGGQIGDVGYFSGEGIALDVSDTQRFDNAIGHIGTVTDGTLMAGQPLRGVVNAETRNATARNHSATHLLHAALREVLGDHVEQKGSLVAPERLRFDFSHYEPVLDEEIKRIERAVNQWIIDNAEVRTEIMSIDAAKTQGALALFGEKYDDEVRVLMIGPASMELCGGTHVSRSGDIGLFKITAETGIAAGVRRIEAITGFAALDWMDVVDSRETRLASLMKVDREGLESRLEHLLRHTRELEKSIDALKSRLASNRGDELIQKAQDIAGVKVLATRFDDMEPKALREMLDHLKDKLGQAIIVLASVTNDKISLIAGVTPDVVGRVKAGTLVNFVAYQVGGKGGGRPEMAQAGGNNPAHLNQALLSVFDWVRGQLQD